MSDMEMANIIPLQNIMTDVAATTIARSIGVQSRNIGGQSITYIKKAEFFSRMRK